MKTKTIDELCGEPPGSFKKFVQVKEMMNSATIKRFCKDRLGMTVRVRTIPCKAKWIEAWVPSDDKPGQFSYSLPEFPLEFRIRCLRMIYGGDFDTSRGEGGNIQRYSVSMVPVEWEKVIESLDKAE